MDSIDKISEAQELKAFNEIKRQGKKTAQKNMKIGASICLFGVAITLCSYIFSSFNFVLLMYGILIGGAVQFLRGLIQHMENKSLNIEDYIAERPKIKTTYTYDEQSERTDINEKEDSWEDITRCQDNIISPPYGSDEYYCPQCENEGIWIRYESLGQDNDSNMVICPACKLVLHSQPIN